MQHNATQCNTHSIGKAKVTKGSFNLRVHTYLQHKFVRLADIFNYI